MLFISIFKNTAIVVVFLVAIGVYLKKHYGLSFLDVGAWWGSDSSERGMLGLLLVAGFFCFFIAFATFGHVVQSAYNLVLGERHNMLYMGSIDETQNIFRWPNDLEKGEIEYSDTDIISATSFNQVLTTVVFSRDKGTGQVGRSETNFSFKSVFLSLIFFLVFLLPLAGVIHGFAFPVSQAADSAQLSPSISMADSFREIITSGSFSFREIMIGQGFLLAVFFVALVVGKDYAATQRTMPLPKSIYKGVKIKALVVKSKRILTPKVGSTSYNAESDTLRREAVFKVSEGFEYPVYIAKFYHQSDFPYLKKKLDEHLKSKEVIELFINDDLSVSVRDE